MTLTVTNQPDSSCRAAAAVPASTSIIPAMAMRALIDQRRQ